MLPTPGFSRAQNKGFQVLLKCIQRKLIIAGNYIIILESLSFHTNWPDDPIEISIEFKRTSQTKSYERIVTQVYVKVRPHLQYYLATAMQSLFNSKRFQAWTTAVQLCFSEIALPLQKNIAGVTVP